MVAPCPRGLCISFTIKLSKGRIPLEFLISVRIQIGVSFLKRIFSRCQPCFNLNLDFKVGFLSQVVHVCV